MIKRILVMSASAYGNLVPNSVLHNLHGEKWPDDICAGNFPAGEIAIASHSNDINNCGEIKNLIVVHEPSNNPILQYRKTATGEYKKEFYAHDSISNQPQDQEELHIAECFSDFGLPAPKIQAVIKFQNGTEILENFDISKCLGKTTGNFLSIVNPNDLEHNALDFSLEGTGLENLFGGTLNDNNSNNQNNNNPNSNNNFNKDCPTDYLYQDENTKLDWIQKSTGILYQTLDKYWDQATITCRNTFYSNQTNGAEADMIVRDSNSISIRVIHAMESVELEVEQDEAGVVTKLNCFSVGGYPETTNFKFVINGADVEAQDILNNVLDVDTEITCIGIWQGSSSISSQEKSSTPYKSTFTGILPESKAGLGGIGEASQMSLWGILALIVVCLLVALFLFKEKLQALVGGEDLKDEDLDEEDRITEEDPLNSKDSATSVGDGEKVSPN